jgi:hypothetical protein
MVKKLIGMNGRAVVNQFVVDTKDTIYFQSYDSVVAKVYKRKYLTLSNYWNYSVTTAKYVYEFMRQNGFGEYASRKGVEKGIKEGNITLVNVNSLKME